MACHHHHFNCSSGSLTAIGCKEDNRRQRPDRGTGFERDAPALSPLRADQPVRHRILLVGEAEHNMWGGVVCPYEMRPPVRTAPCRSRAHTHETGHTDDEAGRQVEHERKRRSTTSIGTFTAASRRATAGSTRRPEHKLARMSTAAAAMTPIPKSTFVVSTAHCIFETLELCLHTALVCSFAPLLRHPSRPDQCVLATAAAAALMLLLFAAVRLCAYALLSACLPLRRATYSLGP